MIAVRRWLSRYAFGPVACLSLALAPALAASRPRDLVLSSGPGRPAVKAAIVALRGDMPDVDIAVSGIKALFIGLNGDGTPELLVQPGVTFCGSGGCSYELFERSLNGWKKIGDWQVGYIAVMDEIDNGWRHLLIDHSSVWRYQLDHYVKLR